MESKTQFRKTKTPKVSLSVKLIHHLLFLSLLLSGCYSTKKTVERSRPNSEKIDWPSEYNPEEAGFFVHNEIDIKADPQIVWDLLIDAESWPNWYEGMTDVSVKTNPNGKLDSSTVLSFKTMGQFFETVTVKEFEPPYRLSWEATRKDIRGYHAWLIIPTKEGCKVITSETQHGLKAFMQKAFLPNKLRKLHDVWLTEFKNKAEKMSS
ncbi:MAG: SRPBCC domain-containing protein [Bacteroidota bacterium]